MSTPRYSSMHKCMCQHFSTQKHSSPMGYKDIVAFTNFQYKQHIEDLKSAIEPKSIPNIPNSASGSECPQIILDQIFPTYYSQLNQRKISTAPGLNLTAQKPYSQNLEPQDFGMTISAILSLRYNIPHRASEIVNPTLNLLINSSISISGGHPTPAFHIPQDLSKIFEPLQLQLLIKPIYVVLNVSFLMALLNLSQLTNPTVNAIMN
ncbi:hypothetical protein O181_090071 [Austropuccinia psidii MF-1]|uniref:Uncharacterized protein n=1 Tax=Austropuccinia psidii MF-1 TaxID=1389203 RepID=A0A9Q3P8E5_9BASI|nr:hypothetical protein [Austropuccinia psidii MF-1]